MLELLGLKWSDRGLVGAWNGRKITGVAIGFKICWGQWRWTPQHFKFAEWSHWLCFKWSLQWEYGEYLD